MKHVLSIVLFTLVLPLHAAVESRSFADAQQEQAYKNLTAELRCLVCQNQNIADSNAELAKDLRNQVYNMLQQGKSQQDIVDFMTQRYGDFVLYRPAFNYKNLLLWLGPVIFLLIGLLAIYAFARSKSRLSNLQPLDNLQRRELDDILQKGEQD